jgi:hypothetical protein
MLGAFVLEFKAHRGNAVHFGHEQFNCNYTAFRPCQRVIHLLLELVFVHPLPPRESRAWHRNNIAQPTITAQN